MNTYSGNITTQLADHLFQFVIYRIYFRISILRNTKLKREILRTLMKVNIKNSQQIFTNIITHNWFFCKDQNTNPTWHIKFRHIKLLYNFFFPFHSVPPINRHILLLCFRCSSSIFMNVDFHVCTR